MIYGLLRKKRSRNPILFLYCMNDIRIAPQKALSQSYKHSESALPRYFLMFVRSARTCKSPCEQGYLHDFASLYHSDCRLGLIGMFGLMSFKNVHSTPPLHSPDFTPGLDRHFCHSVGIDVIHIAVVDPFIGYDHHLLRAIIQPRRPPAKGRIRAYMMLA